MKVLITGSSGFIGKNLVPFLREKSFQVITCDLTAGCDVTRLKKLKLKTKKISAIVHLAAQPGVIPSIKNPLQTFQTNVLGTVNVLEAARLNKVKRVVFVSSNAALGQQQPPIVEDMVPKPLSPYGAAKLSGEAYCRAYFHSFGLETVVLRFSNVYGPGMDQKDSVVARYIRWTIAGKPLVVRDDGDQTRDFLFVADACRAIELAIKTPKIAGQIFQIGSGKPSTIANLVKLITKVSGKPQKIIHEPILAGEIKQNYASIRKAEHILKYHPTTDLETGLNKTYQWFLKQ